MDHESLRTAGTYLNNLLLARGLLRNGEPIDFVKPSKDSRAQIINLVHDLILRQDRDREQREHVAITLQTLRADETRKNQDIARLKLQCEESARQRDAARTTERTAVAEVKKVERAMKTLQEQTTKLKTQLAQVKTQCTNDIRKRDLELARLKTHLQGQQRGNKTGPSAPTMTIVGGGVNGARRTATAGDPTLRAVDDPEYSLKQETADFLTELSQSLSDENDSLISLIRRSLSTMRDLLGLPANHRQPDSAIGSMASADDGKTATGHMLHALPTSYDTFSAELDTTLAHLKQLLTNPNFVSMEEVEVRDEEIARLREGWERMEQRWKDVLLLMQGWLRRMDTGETLNVEELRRGMGLVSPVRDMPPHVSMRRRGSTERDVDNSLLSSVEDDSSMIKLPSPGPDSPIAPVDRPVLLRRASPKRKRDVLEPPESFDLRPKPAPASPERKLNNVVEFDLGELSDELDEGSLDEDPSASMPRMTVAEKLAHAQIEADEAATAAKSGKSRQSMKPSKIPTARSFSSSHKAASSIPNLDGAAEDEHQATEPVNGQAEVETEDMLASMAKTTTSPMAKRIKIRGRPRKKRKSTLSPDELELLLGSISGVGKGEEVS